MVKTWSLYLNWSWKDTWSWWRDEQTNGQTDERTDGQNYHS